jgi:tetratricopeptide (TPR) repeat protein
MLEHAPYRAATHGRLRDLAEAHPDNGFVQFALGWTARRGGAVAEAEAAYRRALVRWPDDDRILNNLGTTLAMQGRTDEALEAYERATQINAKNAAAHYNRAQLKTLQFDFREATDGLSRASALDFDLVKSYQTQQTDDGYLPLIEQWLAPQSFWNAMPAVRLGAVEAPSLPPLWRSRIEFSGWPFSIAALILAALATLVPGYGLMSFRRVVPALTLFIAAAALGSIWLGIVGPFPYEPGLHLPDAAIPAPVMIGLTVLLYLCSLAGYFGNVARARAQAAYLATPTRSRAAQATDHRPAAAA